jgi:hypothetical protein
VLAEQGYRAEHADGRLEVEQQADAGAAGGMDGPVPFTWS